MQRTPYRGVALHCNALQTACNSQLPVNIKEFQVGCIAMHYSFIVFHDFRATCNPLESLTFSEAVARYLFCATNYRVQLLGNFTEY